MTDDIDWCKEIFTGDNFIFNDTVPENLIKGHFDLAVGSLCDDFIISNSTFSWWMSYLGQNKDKKIYAPDPWFGSALNHIDTEVRKRPAFGGRDSNPIRGVVVNWTTPEETAQHLADEYFEETDKALVSV